MDTANQSEQSPFEGWVVIELMGHRRLTGYLREQQIGGTSFLRLDVPTSANNGEQFTTQLYAPSAVYCITPTTEETARRVASLARVAPVQPWELPARPQSDIAECGESPF